MRYKPFYATTGKATAQLKLSPFIAVYRRSKDVFYVIDHFIVLVSFGASCGVFSPFRTGLSALSLSVVAILRAWIGAMVIILS